MTEPERKAWIKKARMHIAYLEKTKERLEAENAELRAENDKMRAELGISSIEQV